jgi:predicted PurR-regulated permease PerM
MRMSAKPASKKLVVSTYLQYIFLALGALLLFSFVVQIRGVLLTFLLAGVLAYALNPLVRMLERRRVPRVVAVVGSLLVLVTVVLVGLVLLVLPAVGQVTSLAQNPQPIVDSAVDLQRRASELPYVGEQVGTLDVGRLEEFARQNAPSPGQVFSVATGFIGGLFGVFGTLFNLILVVIIAAYLLLDRDRIARATLRALPDAVQEQTVELFHAVEGALVKYLRAQLLLCAIMGVIGWAIMQFTVGEFAVAVGLLVGFTELIPVIGAFLGAIPTIVLALVIGTPTQALIVAALFLVAQQLEGNILVPRITGGSVGVHPLVVLFAVTAATALYGIVGAIFAVPIVAIIAATSRYLSSTLVFERWRKPPVSPLPPGEDKPHSVEGGEEPVGARRTPVDGAVEEGERP